jgi:hypothetical protein
MDSVDQIRTWPSSEAVRTKEDTHGSTSDYTSTGCGKSLPIRRDMTAVDLEILLLA